VDDPRRYIRAMIFIRDRIENGTFKLHELIPSIRQLSDQTGHSRHTIGKALRLLQDQGLVERTPGLGYVAKARTATPASRPTPVTMPSARPALVATSTGSPPPLVTPSDPPAPVAAVSGRYGSPVGWGQGGAGHGHH
jgi:DNA-binding transcriptional MocR family regulator